MISVIFPLKFLPERTTVTGEEFVAKTGQVLNISNGAALQFNSPTKARVFYVAKRGRLP